MQHAAPLQDSQERPTSISLSARCPCHHFNRFSLHCVNHMSQTPPKASITKYKAIITVCGSPSEVPDTSRHVAGCRRRVHMKLPPSSMEPTAQTFCSNSTIIYTKCGACARSGRELAYCSRWGQLEQSRILFKLGSMSRVFVWIRVRGIVP